MKTRNSQPGIGFIALLFFIAATLLAVSMFSVYRAGLFRIEAQEKMSDTLVVLQHLESFQSLLKDTETGQRGYLLTGDAAYLQPYSDAVSQAQTELEALKRLAQSGNLPNDGVDKVARLTQQKLAELANTVQLRRDQRTEAALAIVRNNSGKQMMDGIRAEVDRMRTASKKQLEEASQRVNKAASIRTIAFIVAGLLNLLFLGWAFRKLAAEMRLKDEFALEAGREKEVLATTLESIGDGVIVTDSEGRVTFLNKEAEDLCGLKIAEAAGQLLPNVFRIINETTRQIVENPVEKVLRLGTITGMANHTLLVAKDGREIPIDDSAAPIRRPDGPLFGVVLVFRNVTEERKAQQAAARLAAIVQQSEDAIISKTLEGIIKTWNAGAEHIFGYTRDEVVGKSLALLIPEDRLTEEVDILKQLKEGKRIDHYETVRRRKDGVLIDVAFSVSPLKDSSGQIIGASHIARDITQRKRSEAELREQREWFRVTLSSIGDAVITADTKPCVTFLNPAAESLTGWKSMDAVGKPLGEVFKIVNEQTREPAVNPIYKVLKDGVVVGLANHTALIARNGKEIAIEDSAAPILDDQGKVTGAVMVFHDVTTRRHTENALREEYAVTEHLNEVAKALATELDLAKIVQIITDAGTRITRAQFGAFFYNVLDDKGGSYMLYTLSGVPREAFSKFPMPRATGLFGPTFRGEGVIRLADVRKDPRFGHNPPYNGMPSGHLPVVSYLAVPVFARSGEVLGGLFFGHPEPGRFTERDEKIIVGIAAQASAAMNTANVHKAEQLARESAERANQTKDEFLAMLSHELRTPLTPVLATLSNLCEDPQISKSLSEDLETMRRNVELETRLIDDLLDLTRVARGKLELQFGRVQVGQLVEDAIRTCLVDDKSKKVSIVREISDPSRAIIADNARITQILWNLIRNSIKFSPKGGTITIRAHTTEEPQPQLLLEVQDTGIGIEPNRLTRIFDAFEQGDRTITRKFGGLGLGLAISKAIAESHKGTLTAFSKGLGQGSTFTLKLPLEQMPKGNAPRAEEIGDPISISHITETGVPPLRVLLVEDHEDTSKSISRLLSSKGFLVTTASDVAIALKLVAQQPFDVVVSDVGLPDKTGYDLMEQIRDAYKIPGIAMTGFGMEEDIIRCKAAGFKEHLVKPVRISQLTEAIFRVATQRRFPS